MLTPEQRKRLEKQHYRMVGSHSAVKTCGWTKSMIKGQGGCYKLRFYGIQSNQCMQMTTSMSCANRCTFCWRDLKAPVSKDWKWDVDKPDFILEKSLEAHHKLLEGYKGHSKVTPQSYQLSKTIKHVALSLTGEPITYPRMNELLDLFHQQGISTFIVTNAQFPEAIKTLKPITQLYLSLDAPTKDLLKQIDVPLFADYWERLNTSLTYLKEKQQRTCIRLTMVKGMNMETLPEYAKMIMQGSPDFIEVKSYMPIAASRERLGRAYASLHEEIVTFSKQLVEHLPEYELVSEHISSRVVMLTKKKFKKADGWYTWIDFPKFQELALSGKPFTTDDYLKKTPPSLVGISGKGTLDRDDPRYRHKKTSDSKH
ncbi:MAG TPA: 4-demethylwyosine synthase TYW1 [Candidatus Nanoarchaeia archaeon]|nr:4-demethylwyosine synthase TYW1 [Candidatus Nanoarchaeia archaeon]